MAKVGLLGVLALVVGPVLLLGDGATGQERAEKRPVYRSPNHISLSLDGERAYVVNQTSDSISVLDLAEREVIDELSVGPHPSAAAPSPDGRTLYVTSRWGSALEVVDLEEKRVVRRIGTGYEPFGVSLSSDGRRLYVVESQSNTVSIIATNSAETLHRVPVGRDPRYVAETPDGARLIVGNSLSRDVSIIHVASGRVAETRTLERSSILRDIVSSHDGRWAFVAHIVSHDEQMTLQMERGWIHSNGFSVLDLQEPGHGVTLLLDQLLVGAANPWGLALSSDDRQLYVSLSGVHEVAIVDVEKALGVVAAVKSPEDVVALRRDVEILEQRGIARRVDAGGIGPRGLALNEARGELLVANYFSDSVAVLDSKSGEVAAVIPLGPPQEMTLERRGEMLFNDARLCFQKWFSCASCHQEDATVDGLNWDLANDGLGNPKNAKSMHDVVDTPPEMWTGVRSDMDAAVQAGQRFLGFIPDPESHAALMAYLGNSRRAPNPYRDGDPGALRRGEQVFNRAKCAICHVAPEFTDLEMHDLDSANETDLRYRFDTPSLREVYRTGPYMHDGRAETLREVLTVFNPDDLHGRTSQLTEEELDDLVEYLRSL